MAKHITEPVDSDRLPAGIPYIVGNEAAERFSFYGMKGILVIYMTQYLVSIDGQKDVMSEADAKGYYHLFTSSAYFFPIIGAVISDWFLGKYRTIMSLSVVYCLGHAALALGDTHLGAQLGVSPRIWLAIGLTLIAMGSGGIKPCVSAHVGDQFGPRNHHLLSTVFGWFYFSINLGAFISSVLTPVLLANFGPSVAFGVPGLLMLLATIIFWMGRNKFVHIPPGGNSFLREALSGPGLSAMFNLVVIYLFVAIFWSLFDQTGSAWVLQARYMDREIFGWTILPAQLQAANPLLVLTLIPLFTYVVYPAISRVFPLTPLRKISIGLFLTVIAFAIPTWVEGRINGGRVEGVSSDFNAEKWPAENLLDGETGGDPWLSTAKPSFPQEIDFRLRERSSWNIKEVRLYGGKSMREVLAEQLDISSDDVSDQQLRSCWPRDVEIQISNRRGDGFRTVAEATLPKAAGQWTQTIEAEDATAQYVRLIIKSNYGGPLLAISEVEVMGARTAGDAEDVSAAVQNVAATGYRPSMMWQILAYVLLTGAEVMVSITCLEFSYTQAPKRMKSLVMGLFLLSVSAGNLLTAAINFALKEELQGTSYYLFFTGMMLVTAVAFVFVAQFYRGQTYIHGQEGDEKKDLN